MNAIRWFEEIGSGDVSLVGGKGLSLGLLSQAGLPVPPGFCVTTEAFRACAAFPLREHAEVSRSVAAAYRRLGEGLVAVRSSATAEDGAEVSFAGQQETVLGVEGAQQVLDAVARCWASLETAPSRAYRRRQGVEADGLAMAVVVQRLVPAEVAGVLFTRDPLDPEGRRMLVEAAWGLGDTVVSGRVTPDRFHLDRETGAALETHVGTKLVMARGERRGAAYDVVLPQKQNVPCLTAAQLAKLAELGRRVEAYYGEPRDVEWAWAGECCWLLQARPITAATAAEREQVRREEIAQLAARAEPHGTVWSQYNLAEVLRTPTPMTWAIVRRFMSGRGGYGLMHRDLGFDPDPALDEDGIFDLVCGRPYCNLSRQLRLQFRQPPLEYPFAALKAAPEKALYPQPVANPSRAGPRFWLTLPWVTLRLAFRIARLHRTLPRRLREEVFPAFAQEAEREAAVDLQPLDVPALLERLEYWMRRTLHDFARESLKPTALAGMVLEGLERKLARLVGREQVREVLGRLVMGVHPDPGADLPAAVGDLAAGRLGHNEFLRRFGHRGSREMELAEPRWAEGPFSLRSSFPTSPERERG